MQFFNNRNKGMSEDDILQVQDIVDSYLETVDVKFKFKKVNSFSERKNNINFFYYNQVKAGIPPFTNQRPMFGRIDVYIYSNDKNLENFLPSIKKKLEAFGFNCTIKNEPPLHSTIGEYIGKDNKYIESTYVQSGKCLIIRK